MTMTKKQITIEAYRAAAFLRQIAHNVRTPGLYLEELVPRSDIPKLQMWATAISTMAKTYQHVKQPNYNGKKT
jgi:phage terminase small subunit